MLFRHFRHVAFLALILLAPRTAAAADFGTYREFKLGASTADVIAQARAVQGDLKTLHERPALLQELSWRPNYSNGGDSPSGDSLAAIVFSFVDNQLFRIAVDYDRLRTEGLTKEDMIASLSAVYGPRSTRPVRPLPRPAYDSLDTRTTVALWNHGDTTIVLNESAYSGGFGLVITSAPLETLARKAQATAVAMDTREAPAREAARTKAEAAAARAAAEKTRTTNQDTFTP